MKGVTRRIWPVLALAIGCGGKPTTEAPEPEAPELSGALAEVDLLMRASMNPQADPCTDFYEYACGGWMAAIELPADKARYYRSFTSISDDNEALLKGMLDGWMANPGDDATAQQLGAYYGSCMDEAAIEAAGLTPVQADLDRARAVEDLTAVWTVAAAMQVEGLNPYYGIYVSADLKDPDLNILYMGQGGMGLPERSYYLDDESEEIGAKRAAYEDYLARLFVLAGDTEESAQQAAVRVMALETALATMSMAREDMWNPDLTYNKYDRAGLDALTPDLSWGVLLDVLGKPDASQFNVSQVDFITGLQGLMKDQDMQAHRDYLRSVVLRENASALTADFVDANFDFYNRTMRGQQEIRPRWKRCVGATSGGLGELLGRAYVQAAFAGESKEKALEMIMAIEQAFVDSLADLAWMDDTTRERAIEKAHAVTNKIGYPDEWRDFSSLEFDGNYAANRAKVQAFNTAYYLDMIEQPVDPNQWFMNPHDVNAYYNPSGNEIVFPAGILQPPFYSADYPMALNFGAIGMVMGHELTHGFDDDGRKFSPSGELTDWWAEDAVERYEAAAACVEEQYSGFEVAEGLKVNGTLTLGENIADLGGIKQTHLAYMEWAKTHDPEPVLGGLTPEQQVFIGFAQGWCAKVRPDYLEMQVRTDSHSPARQRVNGPLMNLPAFGEAFSCEVGSPMRPEAICEVW